MIIEHWVRIDWTEAIPETLTVAWNETLPATFIEVLTEAGAEIMADYGGLWRII